MKKFKYHGKLITAATKKQAVRRILAGTGRVLAAASGSWSAQYGNFKLELQVVKGGSLSVTMTNPGLDELENHHTYKTNIEPELHALIPAEEVQSRKGTSPRLKNAVLVWLSNISEQLLMNFDYGKYDETEFEEDSDGDADTYQGEFVDDDQFDWYRNLAKARSMEGIRSKVGDVTPLFRAVRGGFNDLPWDKIASTCAKFADSPTKGTAKALDKKGNVLKKGDMIRVPDFFYGSGGTAMVEKITKCPDGTFDVSVRGAFPAEGDKYHKSPNSGTFKASEVVKIRYGKLINDSDAWRSDEEENG